MQHIRHFGTYLHPAMILQISGCEGRASECQAMHEASPKLGNGFAQRHDAARRGSSSAPRPDKLELPYCHILQASAIQTAFPCEGPRSKNLPINCYRHTDTKAPSA